MAIRDPERYFDRRTIKRHLKRGHASEGEYQAYLAALPDLGDAIKPKDEGGDDDGFEARMGAKTKSKDAGQDQPAPAEPAPAASAPAASVGAPVEPAAAATPTPTPTPTPSEPAPAPAPVQPSDADPTT